MSGLDKILSGIHGMAQENADELLGKARAQADAILAQAKAEAKAQSNAILEQAARTETDVLRRAQSSADLQKRRAMLTAKQSLIGEAIDKAHASLRAMPTEKMLAALVKLAARYAMKGEGTICFSAADLSRLPANFSATLNAALPEGSTLAIDPKPRDIDGGFVLIYGGIEENCSFDALFAANREALQDVVRKTLFA